MTKKRVRVEIPLVMFEGNLECLLENTIPCTSISLKQDPNSPAGVILMVGGGEEHKEIWNALGFTTGNHNLEE